MLMLAFESSAKSASVALVRDGELMAQYFQNCGLTHSRTLLPMAEDILKNTETKLSQVDALAVAQGPGSFTGIRIGVSAVKGLAWAGDKPVCGVSTLEAIAWQGMYAPEGALICAAMDARRSQLYNALFRFENGRPVRLCEDRAIAISDLASELRSCGGVIYAAGDGALVCVEGLKREGVEACALTGPVRYQSAWGVAMAAQDMQPVCGEDLYPVYLRMSQAERERQAHMAAD